MLISIQFRKHFPSPKTVVLLHKALNFSVLAFQTCHISSPSATRQTRWCLLGRQSDPFGVHAVSPLSHLSHLILDRYQDSHLPLTSAQGHSLHFITQRQAVVARQTIPLAPSWRAGSAASTWIYCGSVLSRCTRALVSMCNDLFQMHLQLFTPRK